MSIDVFGIDRFQTVTSYDMRPRQARRACNLLAAISTRFGDTHGHVINISEGGVGLLLDPVMRLKPGEIIIIRHRDIGDLTCTVRWSTHPRYGAEFDPIGKKSRTVRAFYDSLPDQTG